MSNVEVWRPVLSCELDYEVSDQGRVRRITGGRGARAGHILKPFITRSGYRQVALRIDSRTTSRLVCQLVCESFHGARPVGMEVRHLDGDSDNDSAENLTWGTRLDNAADMRRHGTHHNTVKTHCKNGHEFTVKNTIPRIGGKRRCRACALESGRRSKARRRGQVAV